MKPLTILVAHNYYQLRGGEDAVFEAECNLLSSRGHRVIPYVVHNDDVQHYSALQLARATLYNTHTAGELAKLFRQERPDVLHVHNTLPLLSPAAYFAAHAARIPVVQTLHNYRLLCPNALFFREGRVCEDCLGKPVALDGVRHRCYRGSAAASAVVAATTAAHRVLGTWSRRVTLYIALTEFARRKFIAGGLPAERIVVKPNFVELNTELIFTSESRNDALYVGRLSAEKGAMLLLQAWKEARARGIDGMKGTLTIVGSGPLEAEMREFIEQHNLSSVQMLGQKPLPEVLALMERARCLVFPSELYETFGKSMVEAFACGTPVICSGLGAMQEIVRDGVTGLHCTPHSTSDLAAKLLRCWQMPDENYQAMRHAARVEYEARYTASLNGEILERIYAQAIAAQANAAQVDTGKVQ